MAMFRTEYYYFMNFQYQIRDAKYIHNISVISHDGQIIRFINSGPYWSFKFNLNVLSVYKFEVILAIMKRLI